MFRSPCPNAPLAQRAGWQIQVQSNTRTHKWPLGRCRRETALQGPTMAARLPATGRRVQLRASTHGHVSAFPLPWITCSAATVSARRRTVSLGPQLPFSGALRVRHQHHGYLGVVSSLTDYSQNGARKWHWDFSTPEPSKKRGRARYL